MSDLGLAVKRLRDSEAGLSESERADVWRVVNDQDHWWVEASGVSIANCGLGSQARHDAEHIALAHNAVVYVANLLEAVDSALIYDDGSVKDTADSLASAILHTDQHDGEGK